MKSQPSSSVAISVGLPESGWDPALLAEMARRVARLPRSFLYLVPTHRMARHLKLALLERNDVSGILGGEPAMTFGDFISYAFPMLDPQREPLSDSLASVVIISSLDDPDQKWRMLRPEKRSAFPGLVQSICRTIRILKEHGISSEEFRRRIAPLHSAKHLELARLRERYDAFLARHRFADSGDMALTVAEAPVEKLASGPLANIEWLVLDGFYHLSPVQLQIVEKLLQLVPKAHIRLAYEEGRELIFGPTRELIEHLRARAKFIARPPQVANPFLSASRQIFTTPTVMRKSSPAENRVAYFAARTRAEEVARIASEIRRMQISTSPPPLRRILVTFAREEAYAPLIREIFPRYGIQFNFSYGFSLLGSPIVTTVVAMLEAVESGYRREPLVRFLCSPYVSFATGDGAALDKTVLDRESRAAGIIEGRESWCQKLRERAEALREGVAPVEASATEIQEARFPATVGEIEKLIGVMEQVLRELSSLEADQTPPSFIATILRLMDVFKIEQNIVRFDWRCMPLVEIEKDIRALRGFRRVLEELEFASTMPTGARPMSLTEFHASLRAALSGVQFQVATHDDAGVQVMGIRETRGLSFDVVFVAGLVAGEFPWPVREEVLLAGEARRDLGLHDPELSMSEQRALMLHLLSAARNRLVLSWPQSEADNPLVRSPFLDELESLITDKEEIPLKEEPLFSRGQLARWLGRHLVSPPGEDAPLVAKLLGEREALGGMPEQVAHAVRVEIGRHEGADAAEEWARPYLGVLSRTETAAAVWKKFGRTHRFSVSQIENYARCPFAFFARYVLEVKELEVPEEELTALTRGRLLHEMLREFYMRRREAGLAALRPDEKEEAHAALADIVARLFEQLPYRDLFWQKAQESISGPEGLLKAFVEAEVTQGGRCEPRLFEFAFGQEQSMAGVDPKSVARPLEIEKDIYLAGVIDRVDVSEDGKAVVVDYKSESEVPTLNDILEGQSYQLPIYLMAVRDLLKLQPSAGQYFKIRAPYECGRYIALGNVQDRSDGYFNGSGNGCVPNERCSRTLEEVLEKVRADIVALVSDIRALKFPITESAPEKADCEKCPYRRICRRR